MAEYYIEAGVLRGYFHEFINIYVTFMQSVARKADLHEARLTGI